MYFMKFAALRKPLNRPEPISFVIGSALVIGLAIFLGYISFLPPNAVQSSTPIWPIGAIYLTLYYFWGVRAVPAIVIGTLITNGLIADRPLWIGVGFALSTLIGVHLAAAILGPARDSSEDVSPFSETARVILAAIVMPLVNTVVGVTYVVTTFRISSDEIPVVFAKWWLGFFLGILLVTPLLLAWWRQRSVSVEGFIRFLGVLIFSAPVVYFILFTVRGDQYIFGLFPLLLIAAWILPRNLFLTSVLLLNCIAVYATIMGFGPFHAGSAGGNLTNLQVFLGTVSVTAMAMEGFFHDALFKAPVVALLAGWLLSGMTYFLSANNQSEKDVSQARSLAADIEVEIMGWISNEASNLRLIGTFVKNSAGMDRDKWRSFSQELDPNSNFPGMSKIGVLSRMASLPPQDSPRFVVTFVAPENESNVRLLGLDVGLFGSKLVDDLRFALERAEPVLTSEIKLPNTSVDGNSGSLYVPFYKGVGTPPSPRIDDYMGFVFGVLNFQDFFGAIVNKFPRQLTVTIFDGPKIGNEPVFVSAVAPQRPVDGFEFVTTIRLANRPFTIGWGRSEKFLSTRDVVGAVLSSSAALLTLFLAVILVNIQATSVRAERLAAKRTKELEMQRALMANAAKMASLGEMAGGIAHEINNPLAIIHGTSQMLQNAFKKQNFTQEGVLKGLNVIENTSMRISKIVRGMRALSRSGENDPFQNEPLKVIIEQTLGVCGERFKVDGIELIVDPIPDVSIVCRATQIDQVLLNLLNNSRDAVMLMPSKRWVRLSFEDFDEKLAIAVSDSGPGVPEEIREKIFQPFYTTKEGSYGLGLGLSISLNIAASHHGRLYLDETVPYTRFVLELPKASVG